MVWGMIACAMLLAVSIATVARMRGLSFRSRLFPMLFPVSLAVIAIIGLIWADERGLDNISYLIALTLAVCCPLTVFLFRAVAKAQMAGIQKERLELLEQQQRAQVEYRRALQAQADQIEAIRASILAELDSASADLEQHRTAHMKEGLANAMEVADSVICRFCEDRAVDAAVTLKARECERQGIAYDFALEIPEDCPIPSVEMSAVLSNLLDNAIAAAAEFVSGGAGAPTARISAKAALRKGYLTVNVRNPVDAVVAWDAGWKGMQPVKAGRKAEDAAAVLSHGWGMAIVAGLAERRGGRLSVGVQDGEFIAQAVMECN